MTDAEAAERYHHKFALAFVKARHPDAPSLPDGALLAWARAQGTRIHRFKRSIPLPRVHKILGFLRAIQPGTVLDVGSGRGTALWPMMDALPTTRFISAEVNPKRAEQLYLTASNLEQLDVVEEDAQAMRLPGDHVDVVTMLEVLEHMPDPAAAMAHALRVSRNHVVITVPSKEDNNPEHIHLFTGKRLEQMLSDAGARKVQVTYIHNHIVVFAR
ncbi:MAG: class I SAM-dependent methyltransferase [Myxococcota bacterium]